MEISVIQCFEHSTAFAMCNETIFHSTHNYRVNQQKLICTNYFDHVHNDCSPALKLIFDVHVVKPTSETYKAFTSQGLISFHMAYVPEMCVQSEHGNLEM